MYRYFGDDFLKLLRKGVFPHEYMNYQWRKKLKKKKLPDIKYFHSYLTTQNIQLMIMNMLNISLIILVLKNLKNTTIYML